MVHRLPLVADLTIALTLSFCLTPRGEARDGNTRVYGYAAFMGELVYGALILVVPAALIAFVFWKARGRRHFAWFRVVEAETGKPLVGLEVRRVASFEGATRVMGEGAGATVLQGPEHHSSRVIGTLDPRGEHRGVYGQNTGAFLVSGPGIVSGAIGTEAVSHFRAYPTEPYVCTLRGGMIVPPTKLSPIARGLAPGEVDTRREGFANLYEKPELHESILCWPTLEAAKAANQNGSFARYWKVSGIETGPGVNGATLVAIDAIERV